MRTFAWFGFGIEWWSSRELAKVLTYTDYRKFLDVMRKAWNACLNSGQDPKNHFVRVTEMIQIGKGAEREVETFANPNFKIIGRVNGKI